MSMCRRLAACATIWCLALLNAQSEEGIPDLTLKALKSATVLVKVSSGMSLVSGKTPDGYMSFHFVMNTNAKFGSNGIYDEGRA